MGGDNWIWGIYCILIFISIIEMASASSRLAYRQITNDNPLTGHVQYLIIGFFAFVWGFQNLTRANIKWVKLLGIACYLLGVTLMCALPVLGVSSNGAFRAIGGFQPVELAKTGAILCLCVAITAPNEDYRLSFFLKDPKKTEFRRYIFMLIMLALAAIPIAIQNLSSALILGFTALGIMFLGEVKFKYLFRTILILGSLGGLFVGSLFGLHQLNASSEAGGGSHHTDLGLLSRANTWEYRLFHGDSTPLWEQSLNDENTQVLCAHMAIANSNMIGKFFGESQLRDHLPEAYSDYMYAIIFEETGILGAAFVMLLYLGLLFRCYKLSLRTKDQLTRLLMVGLPLIIVIQALIHMGVCTDAMFVTGQPLPLISKGGMSTMATSACFGILLGLSSAIEREEADKHNSSNVE